MHVESDLGIIRMPGGDSVEGGEVEKVFDIFKEEETVLEEPHKTDFAL